MIKRVATQCNTSLVPDIIVPAITCRPTNWYFNNEFEVKTNKNKQRLYRGIRNDNTIPYVTITFLQKKKFTQICWLKMTFLSLPSQVIWSLKVAIQRIQTHLHWEFEILPTFQLCFLLFARHSQTFMFHPADGFITIFQSVNQ